MAILGFTDPEAAPYVGVIPPADFERSWQLLFPDGRRLQAGAAAVELARMLPAGRSFAGFVTRFHLGWFVELMYSLVSRYRGLLGNLVKDAPGPKRLP